MQEDEHSMRPFVCGIQHKAEVSSSTEQNRAHRERTDFWLPKAGLCGG